MKTYIYTNSLNKLKIEIEADSQQEAHKIFIQKNPSVAVVKYGINKPIHGILDWSFEEKKTWFNKKIILHINICGHQ